MCDLLEDHRCNYTVKKVILFFPSTAGLSLTKLSLAGNLSYIYLGYFVCLCVCHNCGTHCYSFSFGNQTDQGDETKGLEREGQDGEIGKGQIVEGWYERTYHCLNQT
jgi:hypothetical protein